MKRKVRSISFPHAPHVRRLLGLNPGKLPMNQTAIYYFMGGLWFRLNPITSFVPRRSRPHRLEVECNVCGKWFSAGRMNQHQIIHPKDQLSELSRNWPMMEQRYWEKGQYHES